MQVGIVELRAWAIASKELAEKEGFKGVAASIENRVDTFNDWNRAGVVSVDLRPVFNDEYTYSRRKNG